MDLPAAPAGQATANTGLQDNPEISELPKSNHAPSKSSNRNASGNLPPVFKQSEAVESGPSSAPPAKPVNRPAASKNAIVHSVLQRRNPVLALIRNVGLEIGDISVDFQVGTHNGVLFLSLKYHRLHPEYIHTRIEKIRHAYNVRILLILCDINEHQQPLRELSKICVVNDLTMLVAFSNEEAAQYLSTLKAYEHKSADSLKEKVQQSYRAQLEHVLTSGRKVNKSNAEAIAAQFGSFDNIVKQSNHTLSTVKGLGKVKVISLLDAFNKPFVAGGLPSSDGTSMPPSMASGSGQSGQQAESPDEKTEGVETGQASGAQALNGASVPTRPRPDAGKDTGIRLGQSPEEDSVTGDGGEIFKDPLDDSDSDDEEPVTKRPRV